MLFIHKEGQRYPHLSVFTDMQSYHKDKNQTPCKEEEYLLVTANPTKQNEISDKKVMCTLMEVLKSELGVENFEEEIYSIFQQWIKYTEYDYNKISMYSRMSQEGMRKREEEKIHAEWKYFNNYIDMGLAIFGESMSRKNRDAQEKRCALTIIKSEKIKKDLNSVAKKMTRYMKGKEEILNEKMDKLIHGKYDPLTKIEKVETLEYIIENEKCDVENIIPILYHFSTHAEKLGWEDNPIPYIFKEGVPKTKTRINVSTVNEDAQWTNRGRFHDLPMWAGPSQTAQRILYIAREADATSMELLSLSYAIFAFWNHYYPHTATPIHTLYEVMTVAYKFLSSTEQNACKPENLYISLIVLLAPGESSSSSLSN